MIVVAGYSHPTFLHSLPGTASTFLEAARRSVEEVRETLCEKT